MKIRKNHVDETFDNEYEVIHPYSPLLSSRNKDLCGYESYYLVIMPDGWPKGWGHYITSCISSFFVNKKDFSSTEEDEKSKILTVGQRWRWRWDGQYSKEKSPQDWIVEILKINPSKSYADCQIVQVNKGSENIGNIHQWSFDCSFWEYLEGQARPI